MSCDERICTQCKKHTPEMYDECTNCGAVRLTNENFHQSFADLMNKLPSQALQAGFIQEELKCMETERGSRANLRRAKKEKGKKSFSQSLYRK